MRSLPLDDAQRHLVRRVDAPTEFTRFTQAELTRGFLALAFGSDMQIGGKNQSIRRMEQQAHIYIVANGHGDALKTYRGIVAELVAKVSNLDAIVDDSEESASVFVI